MRLRGFEGAVAKGSFILFIVLVLISIFSPLLSPYDPNKVNMGDRLEKPSWKHLLGTDHMGRDLLTRVMYGGRGSMSLAIVASVLSMIVGLLFGMAAGYFGGTADSLLLLATNIIQGLPALAFMIALSAILGPGIRSILIALVATSWTGFSRIVRGEVLRIRDEDFVEGIRTLGVSHWYILIRHILPNLAGTAVVVLAVRVSGAILAIASLSFLGFGIQPPTPDWGVMVRDALNYFRSNPMLIIAPGGAVLIASLSINMLGDALRDLFDIRLNSKRL